MLGHRRQRLEPVGGLPDDVEVGLGGEPADQPAPHHRVVVDHQHPDVIGAGTRTRHPGALARRRGDVQRAAHLLGAVAQPGQAHAAPTAAGSKPTPSSSTCTETDAARRG